MIPAYRQDEIQPEDYLFGTRPLGTVVKTNGDWRLYLPKFERQFASTFDTMSCTTFGTLNALEAILEQKYGMQDVNFSDRFTSTLSGTTKLGNSPQFVAQSVRHYGVISEDLLPFDDSIKTFEQFTAPIPPILLEIGRKWLSQWIFTHQWVDMAGIPDALKFSPLGVAVPAWYQDNDGIYYRPDGVADNHWATLVMKDANFYYVFDSYEPYIKKLHKDFIFPRIKSYGISKMEESSFRKRVYAFIDSLKGYLKTNKAPMNETFTIPQQICALAIAKDGTDFTNDNVVPDEVSCAYAVTTLLHQIDERIPIIAGTFPLLQFLKTSPLFRKVNTSTENPQGGDVVIYATGTSSDPSVVKRGHALIFIDETRLMSNDSATGKWIQNYTREEARAYWYYKGHYPGYIYRYVV